MSFWTLNQELSGFAPLAICSLGAGGARQQYVPVISLTYEWTQMESRAQSVSVTCCCMTHAVCIQYTGNWSLGGFGHYKLLTHTVLIEICHE